MFVSQRKDGVWDVVDGLQRLATIFQLLGILKDEGGKKIPPLKLTKTRYLPSLEGKKWEDKSHPGKGIGQSSQLLIKRAKLDVKIILRESTEQAKYELFQRLNTGGSQLAEQEVRNVLLIMANPDFYRWVKELSKDEHFQLCIGLSENAGLQQYDVDLVIRFLVLRTQAVEKLKGIGDVGEYLDNEAVAVARRSSYDRQHEEASFKFAFQRLAQALGEDSFRRYDSSKKKYVGKFLLGAFEVLAIGLGHNYERCRGKDGKESLPDIKSVSRRLWRNGDFARYSRSGVRASSRIPHTIPLGRSLMAP